MPAGRSALRRSSVLLALCFLALALHAGLLVVLASASLGEDARLLDLLVEAAQGAFERLVLTNSDFCQYRFTPSGLGCVQVSRVADRQRHSPGRHAVGPPECMPIRGEVQPRGAGRMPAGALSRSVTGDVTPYATGQCRAAPPPIPFIRTGMKPPLVGRPRPTVASPSPEPRPARPRSCRSHTHRYGNVAAAERAAAPRHTDRERPSPTLQLLTQVEERAPAAPAPPVGAAERALAARPAVEAG